MSGKRVLVTGGTSGIGQAAVAQLARAGAHVIAQGRDAEKGRRVVEELRKDGDVELATADLSSLASVRELAAKIGAVDGRGARRRRCAAALHGERAAREGGAGGRIAAHIGTAVLCNLRSP